MLQRVLVILATCIFITGCAGPTKPKFQFPMNTRVGIINVLEDYMTHRNFSSLRIGNFTKQVDVDWNLPAYFEDKLTYVIRSDSRYTVIPIDDTAIPQSAAILDQVTMTAEIKPRVAEFLEAVAEKHDLDVVVIVKSYRGPSAFKLGKHPFDVEGYGLFTKVFLISKQAYAYANTGVIVYKTKPLAYIGSGKPQNKKSSVSNFDLSGDLQKIPQSEISKLLPIMHKYADQAIKSGLKEANLISK